MTKIQSHVILVLLILYFVWPRFMRVKTKTKKIINFKVKKGKNKYNMMGWRIKRLQFLKIIFVAIKAKTLVGPCWILDRLVGDNFPFETIVYGLKSELKNMKYHKKTLIESSLFLKEKLAVLNFLMIIFLTNLVERQWYHDL